MCTVTVISLTSSSGTARWPSFRLACNRDEQRTRPAAEPPIVQRAGALRAVWPVDPVGGGTWIGANECGVALSLLNRHVDEATPQRRDPRLLSRGAIIPAALAFESIERVARYLSEAVDPGRFPRFRLIGVDGVHRLVCEGDGTKLQVEMDLLGERPLFMTSSGLGDALVEEPRRRLFDERFLGATSHPRADADGSGLLEIQDEFHRHSWAGCPHLSVCMRREAARTVSFSAVRVSPAAIEFHYHAGPPDEPAPETRVLLHRKRAE